MALIGDTLATRNHKIKNCK